MGLDALYMVQPREFPHNDADVRASGARDVLQNAQVSDTLADALRGCVFAVATSSRRRELRHETMTARQADQTLLKEAHAHRVALVFGNETSGLNGHEASLCNVWAHIPANPEYSSLNLAAAVQIFAYELRMATETSAPASPAEFEPAAMEDVERLYEHFERTMIASGFVDPRQPKRLLARLRRLLARARLEIEEVNILRGFLKSVDRDRR